MFLLPQLHPGNDAALVDETAPLNLPLPGRISQLYPISKNERRYNLVPRYGLKPPADGSMTAMTGGLEQGKEEGINGQEKGRHEFVLL